MAELIGGLFKNAVPLDVQSHGGLRFSRVEGFQFAETDDQVPLVHAEWIRAARHYPIAFSQTEAGVPDLSYALFKLIPEGQNPYLDPVSHGWRKQCYIPQYLRFYPFLARIPAPGEPLQILVDPDAPHFENPEGEPLFDDNGELLPMLVSLEGELKQYMAQLDETYTVIALLHQQGLLSSRRIFHQENDAKELLAQIISLDPDGIARLPADRLSQLNQQGILPLVFAQMHSLINLAALDRAPPEPVAVVEPAPAPAPPDNVVPPPPPPARSSVGVIMMLLVGVVAAFLAGSWLGPWWGPNQADTAVPVVKGPEVSTPPQVAAPEARTAGTPAPQNRPAVTQAPAATVPTPTVTAPEPIATLATETAQPEAEPPPVPEAPRLSAQAQAEIDRLVRAIQANIDQNRLSRPEDDNAIDKINRIFALDAESPAGNQAKSDVVNRYIQLARQQGGYVGKLYLTAAHGLEVNAAAVDRAWRDLYGGAPNWPQP